LIAKTSDWSYVPAKLQLLRCELSEDGQRNMDVDAAIGQQVAVGERLPSVRIWKSATRSGISVSRKDVATDTAKQAMHLLAADGYDVVVRQTGGTAVPQGPGILHLSFLFGRRPDSGSTDVYYRLLCDMLIGWLATLGVQAEFGALEGSYCDGNYNVIVNQKKLVGTAQAWRGGLAGAKSRQPGYILAHACIVISADMVKYTHLMNRFYTEAGIAQRIIAETSTTLCELLPTVFANLSAAEACEFAAADLHDYLEVTLPTRNILIVSGPPLSEEVR